jgi:hypothetical protein
MNDPAALAAALGARLWTTDAFIPAYRTGASGRWRINPGGALVHDHGYHTGPCLLAMLPSLSRKSASAADADDGPWETWMSITPLEVESQELGYRHAFGHTVVMGLGMGWVAANCALNPRVTRVTVVERDAEVIRLIEQTGAFDTLPEAARHKLAVVAGDALTWRPDAGHPVDFLYADIWLQLAEPGAPAEVRRMQANVRARQVYYWGQEIAIHAAMARLAGIGQAPGAADLQRAIDQVIGLPLLVPPDGDYAGLVQAVVHHRRQRRLPVEVDL